MCGRYASFLPAEALAAIFGVAALLPNFPPSWNVAPTQQRPVIRRHPDTGGADLLDSKDDPAAPAIQPCE